MEFITRIRQDQRWQNRFLDGVSYITLALFLIFLLFPFYFMVVTMLKPESEITSLVAPPGVLNPTLENIRVLLAETPFLRWTLNSVIVASFTTIFSVTIAVLAAYSLVRYRFRGGQTISLLIFVTYLAPATLLFIPMTTVVRAIGTV